jgi:hypothetical protein
MVCRRELAAGVYDDSYYDEMTPSSALEHGIHILHNEEYYDEEDKEMVEMEANQNAHDELRKKSPFFKDLKEAAELECSTWHEGKGSESTTLLIDAIFAALQSLAEKRANRQLNNCPEIPIPTREQITFEVEKELLQLANWTDSVHLLQSAREEWGTGYNWVYAL